MSGSADRLSGRVADFSAPVGLGVVSADDGRTWDFHCTAIADGSRSIDVGAAVTFVVVPGRGGRWEAADLRVAAPPASF